MIKPIVEFFTIDYVESARGAKWELFAIDVDGKPHPYRSGLLEELKKSFGIYIFYDSRGRALYAGKARRQSIWKEMHNAYNRERGDVQAIKRVDHPYSRVTFRSFDEKNRAIVRRKVPLHELSFYFSAYAVTLEHIDDMEAFLIRAFANDLLNTKCENFSGTSGFVEAEPNG